MLASPKVSKFVHRLDEIIETRVAPFALAILTKIQLEGWLVPVSRQANQRANESDEGSKHGGHIQKASVEGSRQGAATKHLGGLDQ